MASTFDCSFLMYRALDEPNSDVIARSMPMAIEAKKPLTNSQIRSNVSIQTPQKTDPCRRPSRATAAREPQWPIAWRPFRVSERRTPPRCVDKARNQTAGIRLLARAARPPTAARGGQAKRLESPLLHYLRRAATRRCAKRLTVVNNKVYCDRPKGSRTVARPAAAPKSLR